MTINHTTPRRLASLAALSLVLAAGAAFAGPEKSEKPLKGSFDQPLTTKKERTSGGVTMSVVLPYVPPSPSTSAAPVTLRNMTSGPSVVVESLTQSPSTSLR